MADEELNQLVSEVAREVIAQQAPEELPLYRAQSKAYFANPAAALQGGASKDDMLGFGVGAVVIFLTPIALQVASQAIAALTDEITKTAREQSPQIIRAMVRLLLRGNAPKNGAPAPTVTLTPEQLRRIRDAAFEEARRCRVPDDRAALLADAITGRLATASA